MLFFPETTADGTVSGEGGRGELFKLSAAQTQGIT